MILSHDSYFNTFTPEYVLKNQKSFDSMCAVTTPGNDFLPHAETLIVVQLDSANRPEKISHIICQSKMGSSAYAVEYHPELSGSSAPVMK